MVVSLPEKAHSQAITHSACLAVIFTKDLSPTQKLGGDNEYLRLASTFHGLHAISKQLAPVSSGGIHTVDAPGFSLHCFESPTGVKFFCTSNARAADAFAFLHKAYELYADYVLKVRLCVSRVGCVRAHAFTRSPLVPCAVACARRTPFTKLTCPSAFGCSTITSTRQLERPPLPFLVLDLVHLGSKDLAFGDFSDACRESRGA